MALNTMVVPSLRRCSRDDRMALKRLSRENDPLLLQSGKKSKPAGGSSTAVMQAMIHWTIGRCRRYDEETTSSTNALREQGSGGPVPIRRGDHCLDRRSRGVRVCPHDRLGKPAGRVRQQPYAAELLAK